MFTNIRITEIYLNKMRNKNIHKIYSIPAGYLEKEETYSSICEIRANCTCRFGIGNAAVVAIV